MCSVIVCKLLTNNWFISIVSSILVTSIFALITYLMTVYTTNKKFIKIYINQRNIEMSKTEDGININLFLALDERKKVETTVTKITPKIIILYKDRLKDTIEPEFELIAPQLNSKISFSEDTVIRTNLKLNKSDAQKIGLTWYRIICYIEISTIKNKTKTIYVDLSDQLLNFMIKEPYTPNDVTQNLKLFLNSEKIKVINQKVDNQTEEENDKLIKKIQEKDMFMKYLKEERNNEPEEVSANYSKVDLDDPIAVAKADKEIREEQRIK